MASKSKSRSKSSSTSSSSSKSAGSRTRSAPRRTNANEIRRLDPDLTREDTNAHVGRMAEVKSGKNQGRYGYIDSVLERESDGVTPKRVTLVTRDQEHETLEVNMKDLVAAEAGRR